MSSSTSTERNRKLLAAAAALETTKRQTAPNLAALLTILETCLPDVPGGPTYLSSDDREEALLLLRSIPPSSAVTRTSRVGSQVATGGYELASDSASRPRFPCNLYTPDLAGHVATASRDPLMAMWLGVAAGTLV